MADRKPTLAELFRSKSKDCNIFILNEETRNVVDGINYTKINIFKLAQPCYEKIWLEINFPGSGYLRRAAQVFSWDGWSSIKAIFENTEGQFLTENIIVSYAYGSDAPKYGRFKSTYTNGFENTPLTQDERHQLETRAMRTACVMALISCGFARLSHRKPPLGRFIRNRKSHPYMSDTIVTFDIPGKKTPTQALRSYITNRSKMRAHEVRGHWRVIISGTAKCDHEFSEIMICNRCRRRLIWVRNHERGDAAIGYVRKRYSVTARG